jgi:hypothetical protein
MDRLSGGRKVLIALALVALFAGAVLMTATTHEVQAATNCTYYSNGSNTTIVGQFGYDCCNNPVAWGKKTKFAVCGGCFPCVPPPR